MRFGVSQGMVLAASGDEPGNHVSAPPAELQATSGPDQGLGGANLLTFGVGTLLLAGLALGRRRTTVRPARGR